VFTVDRPRFVEAYVWLRLDAAGEASGVYPQRCEEFGRFVAGIAPGTIELEAFVGLTR